MNIIDVRPKGMYVTIEFSFEQLERIRDFLEKAKVAFDSTEEPEMAVASQYVTETFYPELDRFIEEMGKEDGVR